jgi:hypothetical protein
MAEPSDQELYNKSKAEVDKNYDKPSAYRSMAYTRTYLKNYREKYGDDKKAYRGKNPEELKTWRKEKWIDVKSFLKNPKNPTACGNAPIKKGEYPLCMPVNQVAKYSKSELGLLVQRKNQIGKRRLVKDAFLRDILEPEKITPIRQYKDKYVKEKKDKLPEPLSKKEAEKILKEAPVKIEKVKEPKVKKERAPRPAPTDEEIQKRKDAKNARQKAKYRLDNPIKDKPVKAEVTSVPQPNKNVDASGNTVRTTTKGINYGPKRPKFTLVPDEVLQSGTISFND